MLAAVPVSTFRRIASLLALTAAVAVAAACNSPRILHTTSESSERPAPSVDSIYVTLDLTSNLGEYATNLATAVDTTWAARGLVVHTNPRGHLALDAIPGLRQARDRAFPTVLVVSQAQSVTGISGGEEGDAWFVLHAGLYDTATESSLWRGRIDATGRVDADVLARRLHSMMQTDGVVVR